MIEKPHNQIHPALQFFIFTGIFFIIFFAGNIVGAGIAAALYGLNTVFDIAHLKLASPHVISAMWIIQITGTTLPIFAAPLFFSYVIAKDPGDYIKPTLRFSWVLIILILAIMFISNPIIELLSNINQKMQLPHFLNSLQKWMEDSENGAQKATEVFLRMDTIWDMILNLLFIGLLTAIAEEFMFRGVLQTIFFRLTKNTHAAVWITAILFSAFHMQFFGFLPRLMLGVLFGYFVAWSGSIWPAVWAHFLNNGTAVVAVYLYQRKVIKVNPDDQHLFSSGVFLFSLVIMLFLLFLYRKASFEKKQIFTDHHPQSN
ncbi:MAG TPA: CPBP family intramembrane glutamic endopeptidase [Mucilaginibacter sp.]|jgi:membrane protease YdiL (CAAX protease family)